LGNFLPFELRSPGHVQSEVVTIGYAQLRDGGMGCAHAWVRGIPLDGGSPDYIEGR